MKKFKLLEENEKKIVFAILTGAFIIRLLFLMEIIKTPFVEYLYSDSKLFITVADSFFTQTFWSEVNPFYFSPFYAIFLSLFRLIFSENNFGIYLVQIIINTLTLLFIYFTAKNLFNKNVALLSLLLSALFDSYIFYSGLIMPQTLEIFFLTLLIYFLSEKNNFEHFGKLIFIGVTFGALVLLRESYLIVALFTLVFILLNKSFFTKIKISKLKIVSALFGGLLLVVMPITIVNLIKSNDFVLTNTGEGIYFNFANNKESNGLIPPESHDFEKDPSGQELSSNYLGREVSSADATKYFYGKTFKDIFQAPGDFLILVSKKFVLFFDTDQFPKSSIVDLNFYQTNFSNILKLPLVGYGLISILFLIGFLIYLKSENKNSLLIVLFLSFIFVGLFSFVGMQNKIGYTPLMIIFGAFGIINIFKSFQEFNFKKLQFPFIIVVVFLLINSFLINKPTISNYDAYFHFGNVAQEQERYEEAIYNYNRSLLLNDRYETLLALGNTFAKKKDFTNAMAAYGEAEKRRDDDYYLYLNKGIVLSQSGQYDQSLEAYNQALKLNPNHYPIYRNIGIVFYVNGNYNEALKFFNKFLSLSDDEKTNALVRKDIENINLKLRNQ